MYIPATDNVVKGYEIDNSLRFNDNDSAYLSRTPASAGNRKTWTWAGWVKRGNLSSGNNPTFFSAITGSNDYITCRFNSDDTIVIIDKNAGANNLVLVTSALYRDVGAYYHVVMACDTTQATASDRFKLYINGEQVTSFSSATYPSQNFDTYANYTHAHYVGSTIWAGQYMDGYLADVHFIDGQALTPSDFGEFGDYGEFKPIQYTGTYGTNGFYLDFKASGDLGNDVSGNGNDWTPTNLAATDQMLDTPTNNFATLDGLNLTAWLNNVGIGTLSEGNTKIVASGDKKAVSTFGIDTNKWYAEANVVGVGSSVEFFVTAYSASSFEIAYYNNGNKQLNRGTPSSYGASFTTGDIIGMAVDRTNNQITFYKNGVSQGAITNTFIGNDFFLGCFTTNGTVVWNFGQDSSFAGNKTAQGNTDDNGIGDFYYSPPSGYLALCTANLDEPTVVPSEHFGTLLYTGDNTNDRDITGLDFTPDFTWIKPRSIAGSHGLFDVVRGADKSLRSHDTRAEDTSSANQDLDSFISGGIRVDQSGFIDTNTNGATTVAWNWKANGAGVSNTDGSITSTVSANVDAGFSIVSYTGNYTAGATIGHGLSSAPEMIICKNRDAAHGWLVYHVGTASDAETDYLQLNTTGAAGDNAGAWNDTAPTSSVFTVATFSENNGNGNNHIAYAFHSVDGFSKFGSYTGNGSTDGPFVYTNFKPAFVIIKCVDTARSWLIQDNDRNGYNPRNTHLYPNSSAAEATDAAYYTTDHLSNGFKIRGTGNSHNTNGDKYLYMAFAENPFKNTNGA